MKRYETIFIIDPDIAEEGRQPVFDRITDVFAQLDGLLVKRDDWGIRKLAYEIKKKPRGYYVRLDYCGSGALVDEIERFFRIDDRIMKYMTVLVAGDIDLEKIKAEMAEAEAAEQAAAAAQEEASMEEPPAATENTPAAETDAEVGTPANNSAPDTETVETEEQ